MSIIKRLQDIVDELKGDQDENELILIYSPEQHDRRLVDNFRAREFACRDGSATIIIHGAMVEGLQKIRDEIGQPLIIRSGTETGSITKLLVEQGRATFNGSGF